MIVYFSRHGESTANTAHVISNRDQPHPLTETGRSQALQLADLLAQSRLSAIYASPVPRALETAQIVGDRFGLTPQVNDGLREFDVGPLEGRSDPLTWMRFSMLWNNWFYRKRLQKRIKGGESFTEAAARFLAFASSLVEQYGDSPVSILCIAHGGILKVGLPGLLENLSFEQVRDTPIHYAKLIKTTHLNNKWIYLEGLEGITAAVG